MGAKLRAQVPMGTLMQMAWVACTDDLSTVEDIVDTSGDERRAPVARLSPGQAGALRALIGAEQPKAQMPQFPEVGIGETVGCRPILTSGQS